MTRTYFVAAIVATAAVCGSTAAAQQKPQQQERPAAFEALVKCRQIADDDARLACFDAAAAGLQEAADKRELVVVDREQVRKTKRSLFGLDIPNLNPFSGGKDDDEDEVKSIESTVASARREGNGRWLVTLEDGSSWMQTDDNPLALGPRKGNKIKISKAAMGSYMMRVGSQPGVRVKRIV